MSKLTLDTSYKSYRDIHPYYMHLPDFTPLIIVAIFSFFVVKKKLRKEATRRDIFFTILKLLCLFLISWCMFSYILLYRAYSYRGLLYTEAITQIAIDFIIVFFLTVIPILLILKLKDVFKWIKKQIFSTRK